MHFLNLIQSHIYVKNIQISASESVALTEHVLVFINS